MSESYESYEVILRDNRKCLIRCIIENDNKWYNTNDIGACLKLTRARKTLSNFDKSLYKGIKVSTNGGLQTVNHLSSDGLKHLLTVTRSCFADDVAQQLNLNLKTIRVECVEANAIGNIIRAFKNEQFVTQYSVNAYRVHKRQEEISKALGCTFIRFNPSQDNIFDVINQIYQHLTYITD